MAIVMKLITDGYSTEVIEKNNEVLMLTSDDRSTEVNHSRKELL